MQNVPIKNKQTNWERWTLVCIIIYFLRDLACIYIRSQHLQQAGLSNYFTAVNPTSPRYGTTSYILIALPTFPLWYTTFLHYTSTNHSSWQVSTITHITVTPKPTTSSWNRTPWVIPTSLGSERYTSLAASEIIICQKSYVEMHFKHVKCNSL